MSVKLYNFSGLPDEPLRSLLTAAQRLAGARGAVVVKVTRGGYRARSHASRAWWVSRSFLSRRAYTKASRKTLYWKLKRGHVNTAGGYVVLAPQHMADKLEMALQIFQTAIHEFGHVRDFQSRSPRPEEIFGWRGVPWQARPIEIFAEDVKDEALTKLARQRERKARLDDLIIDLALQLEDRWGKSPQPTQRKDIWLTRGQPASDPPIPPMGERANEHGGNEDTCAQKADGIIECC